MTRARTSVDRDCHVLDERLYVLLTLLGVVGAGVFEEVGDERVFCSASFLYVRMRVSTGSPSAKKRRTMASKPALYSSLRLLRTPSLASAELH